MFRFQIIKKKNIFKCERYFSADYNHREQKYINMSNYFYKKYNKNMFSMMYPRYVPNFKIFKLPTGF